MKQQLHRYLLVVTIAMSGGACDDGESGSDETSTGSASTESTTTGTTEAGSSTTTSESTGSETGSATSGTETGTSSSSGGSSEETEGSSESSGTTGGEALVPGVCQASCETDQDCCDAAGLPAPLCELLRPECSDEGFCRTADSCTSDQECVDANGGDTCKSEFGWSQCFQSCEDDTQCAKGQACDVDGFCRTPPATCDNDEQCAPFGTICDEDAGQCVQCVTDADCSNNLSGTVCVLDVGPYHNICLCDSEAGAETCASETVNNCIGFEPL